MPDTKDIDTVVGLARTGALCLFALGYVKTAAVAGLAAADASFLSRLNPQVALCEAVGGHLRPLELAQVLKTEQRPVLEKALVIGAQERVAARLVATRRPAAGVTERRRRARKKAQKKGSAPSHAHLTLLAGNLFITTVPGTGWTPETVGTAYPLRGQGELIFTSWQSSLHLATRTTKKAETT